MGRVVSQHRQTVAPRRRHGDRSRRDVLRQGAAMGLVLAAPGAWLDRISAQTPCDDGPLGELIRTLPLYGPGAADVPFDSIVGGRGLDARRYTDLSRLDSGAMTTPAEQVFVRTAAPADLPDAAAWSIAVRSPSGGVQSVVTTATLTAQASPQGEHLIECAGNSNPQNFGLMSAPQWSGVPLARILSASTRPAGATAVLVSGRDHAVPESRQSLPGASWVLPLHAIEANAPFLATAMGGRPLTADHGAPVRLVVPGWYGCSWIKWVDAIQWVDDSAPSTTQMLEFAFRTDQPGIPELARDYAAPEIDTAAVPIRVEQRRVAGRLEYRIVGIVWGGTRPVDRLLLRFGSRDPGTPIAVCPAPASTRTWNLWSYRWRPVEPGYYDLTLKAADRGVRTRRLDVSFYIRRVKIDEI